MELKQRGVVLAATLIAALLLGATLTWFILDRTPPSWDDGYYLTRSLELYDTLADKGVVACAARFLTVMQTKPPLIAALPAPIYLAVGRRYRAAYGINVLFLAMMLGAVYGIANTYSGPRAGLIAVAASGTIPVVYGLSHWYLVECGLMAFVCAAIYLMARWDESSGTIRAGLLGATFGFGLLMKASFPLYVLIPFVHFLMRWRKAILRARPVAAFLVTGAVVAAPWYLVNARRMMATALNAGSGETARVYETGAALSASAIGHYLSDLGNATPWLYLAALPLLALMGRGALEGLTKRGLALALLWMSPVVFLALGHYRDIRYAAPLYPAAALLLAWLADAAIRRRGAIAMAGISVVLALGTFSMVQNSFGAPGTRWELGGLLLNAPRLSYARPYDHGLWPQKELLSDIYHLSKLGGGEKLAILLGTNSLRFNADNFLLVAAQDRLPVEIATTAYTTDAGSLAQTVSRAAYFVYKEGGEPEQTNFNLLRDLAIQQARTSGRFTELPLSRPLPDGGVAHVFANTALRKRPETVGAFLSAGLDEIPQCKVTFADGLQLTAIGVSRTSQGIEVKYRWRCTQPIRRDYWCFTHVVDSGKNVIGYLDHRFLNGDPPTSLWNAGDVAVESLTFPLPAGGGAYELRVGAFHRESGERLSITDSTFPVIQERTAAVIAVGKQP